MTLSGGHLDSTYAQREGRGLSAKTMRFHTKESSCNCCNAPNHTKNTIDFLQTIFSFQHVRRSLVRRVTDAQLNSVGERCEKKGTKENCDVGFVKGRTFEVG